MPVEPGRTGRPAGLAALPAAYGPLFDRAAAVLSADKRVRAIWLAGALGRGAADAASDLDLAVAVRDEDFETFGAEWRDWLAAITPTVVARGLPGRPGSFYALTPGCERIDVVTERLGELGSVQRGARLPVMDRDGLDGRLAHPPGPAPDRARIAYLIEECMRQAATAPGRAAGLHRGGPSTGRPL